MTPGRQFLTRITDDPEPTVAVEGDLDFSTSPEFLRVARALLRKNGRVAVDLSGVKFIDSSGLAALVAIRSEAEEIEKALEVHGLRGHARKAVDISGLGPMFPDPSAPRLSHSAGLPPTAKIESPSALEEIGWRISESVVVGRPLLVAELRETAVEAAREAGLSEEEISDVKLAVGEALTNAMRHAARPGHDKIRLKCMSCPSALALEISDQGPGFDPDNLAPPPPAALQSGGLGVHLMKSVMDEVEFFNDERGSRVRMLKRISER